MLSLAASKATGSLFSSPVTMRWIDFVTDCLSIVRKIQYVTEKCHTELLRLVSVQERPGTQLLIGDLAIVPDN